PGRAARRARRPPRPLPAGRTAGGCLVIGAGRLAARRRGRGGGLAVLGAGVSSAGPLARLPGRPGLVLGGSWGGRAPARPGVGGGRLAPVRFPARRPRGGRGWLTCWRRRLC